MDKFSRIFEQTVQAKSHLLTLDCGSSNTRIFIGKRMVFLEPTAVAVHLQSESVLAIGAKAQKLVGKTPPGVSIVFPILEGRVAEPNYFKLYLQAVLQRVARSQSLRQILTGHQGLLGLPANATQVEKQLFEEVLQSAGMGGVKIKPGIWGNFLTSIPKPKQTESYCLLSIGAQVTEIAVFSAGELAFETRFAWGGIRFTELIQEVMRTEEQLAVGWHNAEALKMQLPNFDHAKSRETKLAVRGKDIVSQSSKTVVVKAGIFEEAFSEYTLELLEQIELFLSQLPTELATSCLEQGLYLSGGGSLISDLKNKVAKQIQAEVYPDDSPELSRAQGLVRLQIAGK